MKLVSLYMKLRIRGNSIRLRLTKSEVTRFAEKGLVEETVEFGTGEHQKFFYALSFSTDVDALRAVFENNRISVLLPKAQAEQWAQTNQVGIRAEQSLAGNKTLQILIEKDFACLEKRPSEDDADTYENPLAGKAC